MAEIKRFEIIKYDNDGSIKKLNLNIGTILYLENNDIKDRLLVFFIYSKNSEQKNLTAGIDWFIEQLWNGVVKELTSEEIIEIEYIDEIDWLIDLLWLYLKNNKMYTWFSIVLCFCLAVSLYINGIQSYNIYKTSIAAAAFLKAVGKEKIYKYLLYPWHFVYFAHALVFLVLAIFGVVKLLVK